MLQLKHPCCTKLPTSLQYFLRRFSNEHSGADLYAVLGVKPSATAKEIKSAYYDLSKQHHPDTNPDNRETAAQKFQQVAAAYEVLGSEDQRKTYDADFRARQRARRPSWSHSMHHKPHHSSSPFRHEPPSPRSRPTSASDADDLPPDFDADYRNFVEFQRNRRRKQRLTRQWQMPPEFYNEFGAPPQRPTRSWTDEMSGGDGTQTYDDAMSGKRPENWYTTPPVHRDDVWEAREQAELLRKLEREREAQRFKTPTFEQLNRQQREEDLRRAKEMISMATFVAVACLLGVIIVLAPSVTRRPPDRSERER